MIAQAWAPDASKDAATNESETVFQGGYYFTPNVDVVELEQEPQFENGRLYRTVILNNHNPNGFTGAAVISPFPQDLGDVIVGANAEIVLVSTVSDGVPYVEYDEGTNQLKLVGVGLHLHKMTAGSPLRTLCIQQGADPDMLHPGDIAGCGTRFNVTGSPSEVAAGAEYESPVYVVLGPGGNPLGDNEGTNHFTRRLKFKSLKLRPEDPCYIWISSAQAYTYDSNCGNPQPSPTPEPTTSSSSSSSITATAATGTSTSGTTTGGPTTSGTASTSTTTGGATTSGTGTSTTGGPTTTGTATATTGTITTGPY